MTTLIERIEMNPNPRRRLWSRILMSVAWGRKLDRAAAWDSARNFFAMIGVATVLADFGSMRVWMMFPMTIFAVAAWYADYLRHF